MIKLYENLHQQQKQYGQINIAIALNQSQLWLRDSTKEQLQQWASQLRLDDEQEMQLDAFFYLDCEEENKPHTQKSGFFKKPDFSTPTFNSVQFIDNFLTISPVFRLLILNKLDLFS